MPLCCRRVFLTSSFTVGSLETPKEWRSYKYMHHALFVPWVLKCFSSKLKLFLCVCVCDDWKHFRHSRVPSGARWSGVAGLLGLLSSVTHTDALLLSLNPQVLLWWVLSGKTGPLQTVSPSPGHKWSSRLPTSWTTKSNTTRGYAPYVLPC